MIAAANPTEVLIADDEPIARDLLHLYLDSFGCHVHTARDGHGALAIYAELADRIGLVILDARMPGPSPVQLCERLRQINACVPILFCSGMCAEDPAIRAVNECGYQLLPKPFNRSGLHRAIASVTNRIEDQAAVARYSRSVMG